ncbi:MAG: hypothetical protein H2058_03880 [Muricauda sp.]|nr:hypothetical protein [Allomuricauda sp.]MBA4744377.1 hypothetical protein [Allomuricauda sp.]
MKTILVFKTSVWGESQVRQLRPLLNQLVNKDGCWNFDLEDCDNILRVETQGVPALSIASLLHSNGFHCEELH